MAFLSIVSFWPRVNVSLGRFELLQEENGIDFICEPSTGVYSRGSLLFQVMNKQRREQQRLERKKRQEERQRHRALEGRGSRRDSGRSEADAGAQVTLVKTFAALSI